MRMLARLALSWAKPQRDLTEAVGPSGGGMIYRSSSSLAPMSSAQRSFMMTMFAGYVGQKRRRRRLKHRGLASTAGGYGSLTTLMRPRGRSSKATPLHGKG